MKKFLNLSAEEGTKETVMFNFLIFLPENDVVHWRGLVYGLVVKFTHYTAIYVLCNRSSCNFVESTAYQAVGHVNERRKYSKRSEWISVIVYDGKIDEVFVHNAPSTSVTSVILFEHRSFKTAQLLLERISFLECDYIRYLVRELRDGHRLCYSNRKADNLVESTLLKAICRFLECCVLVFNHRWLNNLVKVSSFGLYVKDTFNVTSSLLKDIIERKKFTVKFVNYAWARITDAVLGVLILVLITSYTSPNDIFEGLTRFQEYMVVTLESTVEWLMGSPAGFKLNSPLNNVLGPFYQFHISLWGTFLKLCNPVLKIVFHVLLLLGGFGFSFQVAIAGDILAVVSVHMYCIYVYASRIHFLQIEGLKILSRLFIGKKRKPLPGKTQSLPYTTEQLLFGTVSFTILLFLLPTTLIYYFVFTTMRIVLIFIGGVLTRVRYVMSVLPVYVTWLWFFDPLPLTCTIELSTNITCWRDGTLVTKISPVCKRWLETVRLCIPETLSEPEDIKWRKLTTDVLVGNLIYPV